MLVTIVLIAEVLVFVWFTVFSLMLLSMYLDSRGMPLPKLDVAGRTLIGSAKLAFITGIVALSAMTVLEIQAFS
ncbi:MULTISPECIES: hypothetical protein [Stappiaceae]|uniref:Uncharacterized protein n=2 Tax=Roseibium TaxID=150830 RepID=A0A0M6Y673_9HYPH|nr:MULTISPECIES: hypothetical protein [Stappiaceae]MCR9281564.1 hypothetical protein [Paracoccaceae bacterium]MEC9403821.1 hypothetical protein [Pseudomonadota bacterium]AMN56209.1 hypothetical protein ACP90_23280 [Labrenzia sp. CP4]AQQ03321.1 hypothetical protein B0E33_06705 [Roseibium aggregatum]MBN8179554.1 hypothetical protein [Roseibium aggregatum]